jgi:chemotaxis protein MotA
MRAILSRRLGAAGPALTALVGVTAAAVAAAAGGFLEPVSLLITVGGTLGVTWATFPRARLQSAWDHLTAALAGETDPAGTIRILKHLAGVHRTEGEPALERAVAVVPDPLLRRALQLSFECRDEDELAALLLAEDARRSADGEAARQVIVTIGKLFPAFGLIGTLIGLALLLQNLGGADVAAIGPGLAIAVLTTLYGAILSNVVVLPLATKLQAHLARQSLLARMVIEGTLLVHRKEYGSRIERSLGAYVGGHLGTADAEGRNALQLAPRAA